MNETFGQRLFRIRLTKTVNEKPMSQEAAARLFLASLAAYRSWEKGRKFPIAIYREKIASIWPEIYS